MPLVTVTAPAGAFTEHQKVEMIRQVTEAVVSVGGEQLRDTTWVIYDEVPAGRFAVGGTPIAGTAPATT